MSTNQFNLLLSDLSVAAYERLLSHAEEVNLSPGQVLLQPNRPISEVYFPVETAISLVVILKNQTTTEVGIVGYKGMIGLSAILGKQASPYQAIVQIPGKAIAIPEPVLQTEFARGEALHQVLLLYTNALLKQIAQISACQTNHLVEQRLARWLLLVREATGKDSFPVTQKIISQMLGVRRASVTEAAIALQKANAIAYSRGQIQILQPQVLNEVCCECHGEIQKGYNPLVTLET